LRLPSILGFLLAGVVIGPHGFGWLPDVEQIHRLAELGVLFLMFTIGLEFSFDKLRGMRQVAIVGGSLQILISISLGALFAWWRGWSAYSGFVLGSVVALSSTAIVLKFLLDRGELDTQYGRIAVAILLFQDLAVAPLMVLVTGLGGGGGSAAVAVAVSMLKVAALIAGVWAAGRWLLPPLFKQLVLTRNRELVFLASVAVCLGTAWIGGRLGLSLAIGSFLAGLMFANSEYAHQLMGDVVPFRDMFVSIFFVSIGLLVDLSFILTNGPAILSIVLLVLIVNAVVVTGLILAMHYPPRIALASGLILSQIGEFSFVLLEAARITGALADRPYQLLLSTAFITMFLTPLLFSLVPAILRFAESQPLLGQSLRGRDKEKRRSVLSGHTILCGYGPTGHDLAIAFQEERIPFILVEMHPARIEEARSKGMRALYGDAANAWVMKQAGIERARAVVVSFSDPMGMAQVTRVVERLNPDVQLVVRTRFEREVPHLYELGADVVVVEEWEASFDLHRMVLGFLGIPQDRITKHLRRVTARKELAIESAIFKQFNE